PNSLSAPVPLTTSDSVDPAKVFQQVTWNADLTFPEFDAPLEVYIDYLRVRIPIPANVHVISAGVVAPPSQTPNPPLSHISVNVTANAVTLEVPRPSLQGPANRIKVTTAGAVTYPANQANPSQNGSPVVLPSLRIVGVPTPAAAGTTINWPAPTLDTRVRVPAFNVQATYACTPDAPTVIWSTAVSEDVQLCDGQPVTVQTGFNPPTAGADVIQGTAGNDSAAGLGGPDRFCGMTGADQFSGGAGNDRALGGAGNDTLRGEIGSDTLLGGPNADTLYGGANRDHLVGGTERDTCNGGPERDTSQTCEVRTSIP
ncbi:MAG TPA: calcium-binding protein, partial [Acidimicrobiales bacterium]|nr:calcium-binding protein [Acidimicrobiales bacterium]